MRRIPKVFIFDMYITLVRIKIGPVPGGPRW